MSRLDSNPSSSRKNIVARCLHIGLLVLRRRRDSNPRCGVAAYSISSRALSTSQPLLHIISYFCHINLAFFAIFDNMWHHLVVQTTSVRPYRLTVRTPGFHPGNRGSIPRRVTKTSQKKRPALADLGDVFTRNLYAER